MQKVNNYKCPVCKAKFKHLNAWGKHVRTIHPDVIPNGFSDSRYYYFLLRNMDHAECVACKRHTEWDEVAMRYSRYCTNPKCKQDYSKIMKDRMIGKYGKVHKLDEPETQKKMLANKKTSGVYKFRDGCKVGYASSYEKDFLNMLDNFLKLPGSTVMGPSPHTYYYIYNNKEDPKNDGKKKFYIPDYYIPDLNLEIEIKQSTNTNKEIVKTSYVKDQAKRDLMKTIKGINYITIMDKDYTEFFKFIENYQKDQMTAVENLNDSTEVDRALESNINIIEDFYKFKKSILEYDIVRFKKGSIKSMISKYPEMKDVIRYTSNNQFGEIYLEGNKLVGFIILRDNDTRINLDDLYIFNRYKGYGLAKDILLRAIKRYHLSHISLSEPNKKLVDLLLGLGFVKQTTMGLIIHFKIN